MSQRRTIAIYIGIFFGFAVVYGQTLYPGFGGRYQWGDATKWQYMGSILGISHPPGSPLYVWLSHLWSLLPLPGSMALRMNALSALIGASCVTLYSAFLRGLGLSWFSVLFGGVTLGLSHSFWVFSTEAEVYSLFCLFLVFIFHRLRIWEQSGRDRDLWIACFALLLGFSVHYMMVTILPAVALYIVGSKPQTLIQPRNIFALTIGVLLALLPFAWIWYISPYAIYSELSEPRNWEAFKDYILVRVFRSTLFNFSIEDYILDRVGWGAYALIRQNGPLVLALVPLGLSAIYGRQKLLAYVLGIAMVIPFVHWIGYSGGDQLAGILPMMPALVTCMALCIDSWVRLDSSKRNPLLWIPLWIGLCQVPYIYYTLKEFSNDDPLARLKAPFPIENLEEGYLWHLPCLLDHIEENAVILPPYLDYGSRQIVLYHQFTDPRVSRLNIRFEYLQKTTVQQWVWASKPWIPDPEWFPHVYAFRENQKRKLERAGYHVANRYLDLSKCGVDEKPMRYFHATAGIGNKQIEQADTCAWRIHNPPFHSDYPDHKCHIDSSPDSHFYSQSNPRRKWHGQKRQPPLSTSP